MTKEEIGLYKVDLAARGCRPAVNFNGRHCIDYGTNGFSAVKHNYMTKNDALISVYDIYQYGGYVATFSTKKAAMAFMEMREKAMSSKLRDLVKEVNNLNSKMHAAIVEVLKANGGIIRTDNNERMIEGKPTCDNIYTISMDGDDEPNTEKRVLAVALIGEEQVAVLPAYADDETIKGCSNEELLNLDTWEWVFGGYTLQNATLTSICEGIEEYV